MKAKRFTFASHTLILVLLLIIPYVSTDQVFSLLDPDSDFKYLFLCLSLSAVLIVSFYWNYYFLIPKYLLPKRHGHYYSFLFLAITTVLCVTGLLFLFFFDTLINSSKAANPIIEKLIPVIITNAVLLWFLAIVSSILWTVFNRLKQTENEKLVAQLTSLRAQINPHFLFNTLNNIYAVALENSPRAADMVEKLSDMMRYTMRDVKQDSVSLEDELNYIDNFIDLQRLRLDSDVKLIYRTLLNVPPLRIAPMLLIPFIENAFKHGVNPEQQSHIKIEITVNKGNIELIVLNNKVDMQWYSGQISGLGINNTKKRLKLIYPLKHTLIIKETGKVFCVSLNINLR